jgi:hypothetical protein
MAGHKNLQINRANFDPQFSTGKCGLRAAASERKKRKPTQAHTLQWKIACWLQA